MREAVCGRCKQRVRTKTTRWWTESTKGNAGVMHKKCYLRGRK